MHPLDCESSETHAEMGFHGQSRDWSLSRPLQCAFVLVGIAICALLALTNAGSDMALKTHSHSQGSIMSAAASCGAAPMLDGAQLDGIIANTPGVLIAANPAMRCTEAVTSALQSKGMSYTLKKFTTPFQYTPGASAVWDWLHCSYPDDKTPSGMIMHSYVFSGGQFQGQGFAAADKVNQGILSGPTGGATCEEQFVEEANVLKQFEADPKNKVLLFGWLACPCTSMAQSRFAQSSVCFEGRTWANPNSKLMKYLQCKEGKPEDHSFIYMRSSMGTWTFIGNGFMFDDAAMPEAKLQPLLQNAGVATTCKHANVKVNVFGTQLEECRTNPADMSGSWQDDGTCSEQIGGVHEICIEHLPADFSTETHQPAWSEERADQRHCVCVGAWSLYMTDAAKHPQHAAEIMPHCKAIPETALTSRYLTNWKDWNGYPANIVEGVGKLVERCLNQVSDLNLQCGLRKRLEALSNEVSDLTGPSLQALQARFESLQCTTSA